MDRVKSLGLLTVALNVADDEMHRYWTRAMDAASAMLFGLRTFKLTRAA